MTPNFYLYYHMFSRNAEHFIKDNIWYTFVISLRCHLYHYISYSNFEQIYSGIIEKGKDYKCFQENSIQIECDEIPIYNFIIAWFIIQANKWSIIEKWDIIIDPLTFHYTRIRFFVSLKKVFVLANGSKCLYLSNGSNGSNFSEWAIILWFAFVLLHDFTDLFHSCIHRFSCGPGNHCDARVLMKKPNGSFVLVKIFFNSNARRYPEAQELQTFSQHSYGWNPVLCVFPSSNILLVFSDDVFVSYNRIAAESNCNI